MTFQHVLAGLLLTLTWIPCTVEAQSAPGPEGSTTEREAPRVNETDGTDRVDEPRRVLLDRRVFQLRPEEETQLDAIETQSMWATLLYSSSAVLVAVGIALVTGGAFALGSSSAGLVIGGIAAALPAPFLFGFAVGLDIDVAFRRSALEHRILSSESAGLSPGAITW